MHPESPDRPAGSRFPVVGIGASAGGLEALRQLFAGLPDDTGMAFIVIQHLDPGRLSWLHGQGHHQPPRARKSREHV
jgi:two-component system CheB/CheR fusion protein